MSRCGAAARAIALAGLVFSFVGSANATTMVAGTAFDDNAFADVLVSAYGILPEGAVLEDVLTDSDLSTKAVYLYDESYVELGFVDNVIVNGGGADLYIYEIGSYADPFEISLTVGGVTQVFASLDTGFDVGGSNVNVAMVDLSNFAIASGATVDNIVIGAENDGVSTTRPLLAVVGARNSAAPPPTTHTPEPGAIALFLTGSAVVGLAIRRRIFH